MYIMVSTKQYQAAQLVLNIDTVFKQQIFHEE